jgi:UDP-glucose 4-epimerase
VWGVASVSLEKREVAILLTGATGFVGRALLLHLSQRSHLRVTAAVRSNARPLGAHAGVEVGDLNGKTDWQAAVEGQNVVIHAAARAHVICEAAADPLAAFREVNVAGTLRLARQAAEAGVSRFIFISSIKVNGESTPRGKPYTVQDQPAPVDLYGISKLEAEEGLHRLAEETGMAVVIIRPVLVYGPGVQANFYSVLKWVSRGVPLPFGSINNQRSLVSLSNLIHLIETCIDHPLAANQTFLVSDGEDLSTTELLRRVGKALGKPARLLPVSATWIEGLARVLGRPDYAKRLCSSLQVDISHTTRTLNWKPVATVDAELLKTANAFLESRK